MPYHGTRRPLHRDELAFPELFDRVVAACARAQRVASDAAQAVARARATRASSRRLRGLVADTRESWEGADEVYGSMRGEVERIARSMRDAGVEAEDAAAAVRHRIRFVLYDGGLSERDTEPVVARAEQWVVMVYDAA
jgi:hypothetical protein